MRLEVAPRAFKQEVIALELLVFGTGDSGQGLTNGDSGLSKSEHQALTQKKRKNAYITTRQ